VATEVDYLDVLKRLGSGRTLDELCQALQTTAQEVVALGKPGTVTLTLKVSNKGPGDVMVIIDEQINRVAPKRDPRGAYYFAVEGGLWKDDPRQAQLTFRDVDPRTGEIRDIPIRERVERTAE